MKTISQMTTAEMIAEYNALTGKSIKKFSTRAAGEKQLIKARLEAAAENVGLDLEAVAEESPLIADVMKADEQAEEVSAEDQVWDEPKKYSLEDGCPSCGQKYDQTPAGLENTAAGDRMFCHHCSTEYHQNGKIYNAPKKGNISDGVKASWKNAEVAAARAKRDAVAVEGKGEFKSVSAAFKALNLPMQKHIKFRMELKAAGKATYGEYKFSIVSK